MVSAAARLPVAASPNPTTADKPTNMNLTNLTFLMLHLLALRLLLGSASLAAAEPVAGPAALRDKTLVAWVRLADLVQTGSGVLAIQDGDEFDAITFGERAAVLVCQAMSMTAVAARMRRSSSLDDSAFV